MTYSQTTTTTDERTFGQLLLELDIHLSPEEVDRLEKNFRVYLACEGYPLTKVPHCAVERQVDSHGRLMAETVKPSSLETNAAFERACQCAQMSLSHLSAMTERFLGDLKTWPQATVTPNGWELTLRGEFSPTIGNSGVGSDFTNG